MLIQVLGPGCPKCAELEKTVHEVVAEAGVDALVEKITDFQKIAAFGVMATPGVVVDGQVKAVGRVPSKAELASWIVG